MNNLLFALALSIGSIGIGTVGFMMIEGYELLEAFYMTMITISTVGFEEVEPLSDAGRLFTSIYIFFNLIVLAFVVSVITRYLFEGELRDIFTNYMSARELNNLRNHVIICGYGRNGYRAAEELRKDGIPYVIVDMNPEIVKKRHTGDVEVPFLKGDATNEETLKRAGIKHARAIIASVPQDSINVFITLTARELNPKIQIIARAVASSAESKLHRAGADNVVMPDTIGGHYMASLVSKPEVIEFLDMINGVGDVKLELEEVSLEDFKSDFRGKTLRELSIRSKSAVTVLACKSQEQGYVFNPNSETVLKEGDVYIIIGMPDDLESFRRYYLK